MRLEINSAADFLVDLARLNSGGLTEKQLIKFRDHVCDILIHHYTDHWFPEKPIKGSGYRCIRINGQLDPLIARAGFMMGLAVNFLRRLFPSELTMWVDPMEVAYRIGENGSICVLYEDLKPSTPPPPTEIKTPVKAHPPPQQTPSPPPALPPHHLTPSPPPAMPPQHHIHQQQQHQVHHPQHHHFSPSKSVVISSPVHHSPPLSPVTTQHHHQQATNAAMLSMFLMGGKDAGSLIKCKESLRAGLDARTLQMDRLFVSS